MAAARVGKEGHVYSFEPCSSTFKILQENIRINKFDNVSLYNLAISDKVGFKYIYSRFIKYGIHKFVSN